MLVFFCTVDVLHGSLSLSWLSYRAFGVHETVQFQKANVEYVQWRHDGNHEDRHSVILKIKYLQNQAVCGESHDAITCKRNEEIDCRLLILRVTIVFSAWRSVEYDGDNRDTPDDDVDQGKKLGRCC